ncbi:hypothetical protein [Gordonibacter sp.]|nr:hypothetical protein [Gordonibacter sp.]
MWYSACMEIAADSRGFSRVEIVCIVGIACFAVALAAVVGWYALGLMWQGNDANVLNTAEGVAATAAAESCLVPGCPGGDFSEHRDHVTSDGTNVAYYDKGGNCLVADPPAGYNESDTLVVEGEQRHVERGSLIIKVTRKNGTFAVSWVEANAAH